MKNNKQSAGILLYRLKKGAVEFFLVHPGGPFWAKKNEGAWSIPKGEFTTELPLDAAKREFMEETGAMPPTNEYTPLTPIKLKSGKTVHAWAVEGDINAEAIKSNTLEIEWPPKSGKVIRIPEVDRAAWFTADEAIYNINIAQAAFITQTVDILNTQY
jgi:predicted NUDIX family NTP pyrophosphohydrolase